MKGYPRQFRPLLLATLLAVVISGLLLVPALLRMRADIELGWTPSGRVGIAALHAGAGLLTLMLTGALWSLHMRAGWHKRRHRGSGGLVATAMVVLALSALGIYYLGDEALAAAVAFVHLGAGLGLALAFGWHWQAARHARREVSAVAPAAPPLEAGAAARFSAD